MIRPVRRTLIMKWAPLIRKSAGISMLLSGVVAIYIIVFNIWGFRNVFFLLSEFSVFNVVDWIDFWLPTICGAISVVFIILGVIATFKGKEWWLAFTGSIFTLPTPIVWQLWPATKEVYVVVPRIVGLFIGIITIILTLLSTKDFQRNKTLYHSDL
jgi:hypothetical protein